MRASTMSLIPKSIQSNQTRKTERTGRKCLENHERKELIVHGVRTHATSNTGLLVVDDGHVANHWMCSAHLLRLARTSGRAIDLHVGKPAGNGPRMGTILVPRPTGPHESLPYPRRRDLGCDDLASWLNPRIPLFFTVSNRLGACPRETALRRVS